MNVIARLEFELAYYDFTVHHFNNYTTRTPPLRLLSSGTKLFITFELKRFFDMRKREAQSFYDDFSICAPTTTTTTRGTRRKASASSESQPSSSVAGTQLTDFSQIPQITPPGLIFLSGIFILTSLNDTSSPCAREHLTHALSERFSA